MVFHMLINGLGTCLKCVRSGDRIDDQSLGRSCDTFPRTHACISHDPKVVKISRDRTCDRSGDSLPGSRGWRVDSTTWLYFSLGAALGELGLGFLWMRDVADSVLNTSWAYQHLTRYFYIWESGCMPLCLLLHVFGGVSKAAMQQVIINREDWFYSI